MICGKTIYPTREDAANAMAGFNSSIRAKSKLKGSYFCNDCEGWHVSSGYKQSKKKRIPFIVSENVNSAQKQYKKQVNKSGTKNLIVHTRLNFKVK